MLEHLRNKFVAGALAAVPIAIVVIAAIWIEEHTKQIATMLGVKFPGLGFLVALVAVYLLGLLVTSVLGQFFMHAINRILERVPGLNHLYKAWKDLLVVSPDKAGMYDHAVLVPLDENRAQVGFTNGIALPGDPNSICVFLPNVPNPFSGRLVVMKRADCQPLKLSTQEVMKYFLSSGNYVPGELTGMT